MLRVPAPPLEQVNGDGLAEKLTDAGLRSVRVSYNPATDPPSLEIVGILPNGNELQQKHRDQVQEVIDSFAGEPTRSGLQDRARLMRFRELREKLDTDPANFTEMELKELVLMLAERR